MGIHFFFSNEIICLSQIMECAILKIVSLLMAKVNFQFGNCMTQKRMKKYCVLPSSSPSPSPFIVLWTEKNM